MYRANAQDPKANNILAGVEMKNELKAGAKVRLIQIPDWLIHDLPKSEQEEMLSFIGQVGVVQDIDAYGYFWLGFGLIAGAADSSSFSGHSFAVPQDCLEEP